MVESCCGGTKVENSGVLVWGQKMWSKEVNNRSPRLANAFGTIADGRASVEKGCCMVTCRREFESWLQDFPGIREKCPTSLRPDSDHSGTYLTHDERYDDP